MALTTAQLYKSLLVYIHTKPGATNRRKDKTQLYCMLYDSSDKHRLGIPINIEDKTHRFDQVQFVSVPTHFPLYLERNVQHLDDFQSVKNWIEDLYYRNPEALVTINNTLIDEFDIDNFALDFLFE